MGNWTSRRKAYAALFLVVAVVAFNDLVWYRVGTPPTFCVWSADAREHDGSLKAEHEPFSPWGTAGVTPLHLITGYNTDSSCVACEYRLEIRTRWVLDDWVDVRRWSGPCNRSA